MSGKSKHSDETKRAAIDAVASGKTHGEVGASIGVSRDTVRIWCRKAGVMVKPPASDEERELVSQLIASGASAAAAAERVGFAPTTVWRWLRKGLVSR